MTVKRISCGRMQTNSYVVGRNGRAVVIDPAGDGSEITGYLNDNGLKLEQIILTHGHYDHIEGLGAFSSPIAVHKEDAPMLADSGLNLSKYAYRPFAFDAPLVILGDGEYSAAGIDMRILHTPGHTRGSICILIQDDMFSGDTLFRLGIGRTDLPGGDTDSIKESLKRLLGLEGDYNVHPGHGESSKLSFERLRNPFAASWGLV